MNIDRRRPGLFGDALRHADKMLVSKLNQDVLNAAREINPDVKTRFRNDKLTGINVVWPYDKTGAECLVKAIDNLLPKSDPVKQTLLNKHKKDLIKDFKIE